MRVSALSAPVRPTPIVASMGEALEEGQIYDMIAMHMAPMQFGADVQHVNFVWLIKRGSRDLVAIAFTAEMPEGSSYKIVSGVARRTNPPA